jgi:hypothetical protein
MSRPLSNTQLQEMFESIIDTLEPHKLYRSLSKFEKYRDLADQSGSWHHRVQAREFIIKVNHESDHNEKALTELFWLIGQRENNPDIPHFNNVISLLERYIEFLPGFPGITPEQLLYVADYLDNHYHETTRDIRFKQWALFKTFLYAGDTNRADKYRQLLLSTQLDDMISAMDNEHECKSCNLNQIIYFYASLGLLDQAIQLANKFLDRDFIPCLTAPRSGIAYLFRGLLDAGRVRDAEPFQPLFEQYLDYPSKAKISIVLPLIRYYLTTEQGHKASPLFRYYENLAISSGDQLIRRDFTALLMLHKKQSS